MSKVITGVVFLLIIFGISSQQNHAFAGQSNLVFYGKGSVEGSNPFAGEIIRMLINKDVGTVVHATSHGIEIVRMSLSPSNTCTQTQSTLCFDGTVTDVKNTNMHQIGDKINLTLDLQNKKETILINSGPMQGTTITISLAKTIVKLDGPFTIILSREGGIAGIRNVVTIDTSSREMVKEDGSTYSINEESIAEIHHAIKKSKFFDIAQQNYPPIQGSADYFTYSIQITQGVFQNALSWADTSENVPKKVIWLKDEINSIVVDLESSPQIGRSDTIETIPVTVAKNFTVSSPTFAFDGIPETLKVGEVKILESFPEQYVIPISFDSLHGGYGNRTDQIVTEAITPHAIIVTVVDGKVVSAIIDEKWDELDQKQIE